MLLLHQKIRKLTSFLSFHVPNNDVKLTIYTREINRCFKHILYYSYWELVQITLQANVAAATTSPSQVTDLIVGQDVARKKYKTI